MGGDQEEISIVLVNRSHEILKGSDKSKNVKNSIHDTVTKALKRRNVPVEFLFGASVTQVYSDRIEYQKEDSIESLSAETICWTAGVTANPLIKNSPISAEYKNKRGYLKVDPTMQLAEYPEVFQEWRLRFKQC